MDDPFIGTIMPVGWNFAARGWAECDGQLLPIAQNQALFALLGTIYGGDGRSTFALPDLRGRAGLHFSQGPGLSAYKQGQGGGSEETALAQIQSPIHSHTVGCTAATGNVSSPVGALPGAEAVAAVDVWSNAAADGVMNPAMTSNSGSSQPHENCQPYLAVTWLIALYGTFPSRN